MFYFKKIRIKKKDGALLLGCLIDDSTAYCTTIGLEYTSQEQRQLFNT
jgi:hypothetical protein